MHIIITHTITTYHFHNDCIFFATFISTLWSIPTLYSVVYNIIVYTPVIASSLLTESISSVPCANPGNPVFSCVSRVEVERDQMNWDKNYKPEHALYKTSSSMYGIFPATHESAPATFHGKSQKFSQHLGLCGMYRNHSLNTWTDRSNVHDSPHL